MSIVDKFRPRSRLREVGQMSTELARLKNALLRENDLFRGLTGPEMESIGDRLPMATARTGQLIYSPGQTGEALFLLKTGRVRIYRLAADGRKIVLATVEPGTAFGEMSLLGESMTGSFAEAMEDCTVCVMSRIDVEEIMRGHPEVAIHLTEIVADRLRRTEDLLQAVAFEAVPVRLARLLIGLSGEKDEIRGFSHQELADMVGTSRETVSRALVDLKNQGAIDIDRRSIAIIDRATLLQRLADPS